MPDINVRFMHPVDGRQITVTMDDTMTAQEAVDELIGANFVLPNEHGYQLAVKGGSLIDKDRRFADCGLTQQDIIRVLPATDAGGPAVLGAIR